MDLSARRTGALASCAVVVALLTTGCTSSADTSVATTAFETTNSSASTASTTTTAPTTTAPGEAMLSTIGSGDSSLPPPLAGVTIGVEEGLSLASGSGIAFPGTVSSNAVDIYRFQAVADTEVTMSVATQGDGATFSVFDPQNARVLQSDGGSSYTSPIPADGQYLIAVQAGDGEVTYELSVSVK